MRPRRALPLLAMLLSACVIWVDPHDSDFDADAVRAAAEVNRHQAALTDAPDLAAARAEVTRHQAAMGVCMAELRGGMHDDWRCDWGGMDAMRDLMHGTEDVLARYLAAADAAADLAALRAACLRYAAEMDDALARMMERWDDMRCHGDEGRL